MTRLLRLAVAFLLAALVLLTAAQQAGTIGPWWLELSRYLPVAALLLPALAALLLSFRLGRGWVLASLATLLLVATVTMGFVWNRADRGAARVRLMTYNIKAGEAALHRGGIEALAREVAQHDPDILVMQDANGLLADLAPANGQVFGLPQVYALGQYVVASRFPLRDCGAGRLGFHEEGHRYVHCVVDVDGVALDLVTAHFESPRNGLNAARREGLDGADEWQRNYADRLTQARALARDLEGNGARPLVVAGDLNAPERSPVIGTLLSRGLRDAFSHAGRGYGYSYGHALRGGLGHSFLRIDHILVSPGLGLADCFVGAGEASAHRPVIADLVLKR